jgi:hypothetical protein
LESNIDDAIFTALELKNLAQPYVESYQAPPERTTCPSRPDNASVHPDRRYISSRDTGKE